MYMYIVVYAAHMSPYLTGIPMKTCTNILSLVLSGTAHSRFSTVKKLPKANKQKNLMGKTKQHKTTHIPSNFFSQEIWELNQWHKTYALPTSYQAECTFYTKEMH